VIGLVTATAAGRRMADRLAAAWPGRTTVHSGPIASQVRAAWADGGALVCFLATGAVVRLVAPLLGDKHTDPGVVCVDEAGRHAVALLGGHAGGANALATEVAAVLCAQPVVTTATDATGYPPLDMFGADLGFRLADRAPVARVTAAVLDGAAVRLDMDPAWPVPALPGRGPAGGGLSATDAPSPAGGSPVGGPPARDGSAVRLTVSDRLDASGDLVYRPPSLVVGVGASRCAPASEIASLIRDALAEAALSIESVRELSTVDVKAAEPGIVTAAGDHGSPPHTSPAAYLAAVEVPNPS